MAGLFIVFSSILAVVLVGLVLSLLSFFFGQRFDHRRNDHTQPTGGVFANLSRTDFKTGLPPRKTILCFITKYPHDLYLEVVDTLAKKTGLETFVISDLEPSPGCYRKRTAQIVFISDKDCQQAGYISLNHLPKNPSGWDKLMYFLNTNTDYSHAWIFEDYVAIKGSIEFNKMIKDYDKDPSDLLATHQEPKNQQNNDWPHWWYGDGYFDLSTVLWKGFYPVCRLSKRFVSLCHQIVQEKGNFCFLEVFFPTIAAAVQEIQMKNLEELTNSVVYHPPFTDAEVETPYILHHP